MKTFAILLTGVLSSGTLAAQTLSVYFDNNNPLQFVSADGKPAGFAVDVVREIQLRIQNRDTLQQVPWARGLDRLGSSPNTLLLSMARTAYRENRYQWIAPTFQSSDALCVNADSKLTISDLEDAKKIGSIGVYIGDINDQTLMVLGFTNLDRANSNISNLKKLMAGRIALLTWSPTTLKGLVEQTGYWQGDLKLVYEFMHTALYIAASSSKDATEITQWNKALEQMKRDRTFEEMFKRHFPFKRFPGQLINHCHYVQCNRQIQLPTVKQRHSPVVVRDKTTTAVGLNGLNDDGKASARTLLILL